MSGCCQQRRLQSQWERYNVSISQSSGFSCQGTAVSDVSPLGNLSLFPSRNRAASHVRGPHTVDRAVSLRHIAFPSRYRAASQGRFRFRWDTTTIGICFNLVIERLLISGQQPVQVPCACLSFHLVIERLLMSGFRFRRTVSTLPVSISLSSGFSFQASFRSAMASFALSFQSRYRAASHFRLVDLRNPFRWGKFQSRYRAASHFRVA